MSTQHLFVLFIVYTIVIYPLSSIDILFKVTEILHETGLDKSSEDYIIILFISTTYYYAFGIIWFSFKTCEIAAFLSRPYRNAMVFNTTNTIIFRFNYIVSKGKKNNIFTCEVNFEIIFKNMISPYIIYWIVRNYTLLYLSKI